jgi:putative nucleotidyltransferase with HDIG domain
VTPDAPSPSPLSEAAATHLAALRERLRDGTLELPLLPEVPHRVREATQRDGGDARALTDLIRRDAAFAGHLLRVANSPAYAGRSPIGSLQQAVSRLGVRTIGEIALVIACRTRAFAVRGHDAALRALFQHSLATALHAREIARVRRLNVEDAFLGGLMHDIGRPILIQALVDAGAGGSLPPLSSSDFDVVVRELHAEAGAAVVRGWGLSERLALSVRFHHDPAGAGPAETDAALIAFADELAHHCLPLHPSPDESLRAHAAAVSLNLYPEDVDALVAHGQDVIVQVQGLL